MDKKNVRIVYTMVYARNYRKKRMSKRPSRYTRKRRFNTTKKKFGKTGFFQVIRWSNAGTDNTHVQISGTTASSGNSSTQFALNNVAGSGELQALFDNYRIVKVLYRWVLNRDPDTSLATSTSNGFYPRLTWVHDFNDAGFISRTQMMQHGGMREFYFTSDVNKTKWYSLNPSTLSMKYETPTLTGYTPKWREWFDTSDNQATHYGLKYCWDLLQAGLFLNLEAKLVIQCKGIS